MRVSSALLLFVTFPRFVFTKAPPKIAIIGGGIGGSSCAYFLNQLFKSKASVTLFEKDEVGGRLSLIDVDGKKYEAGGSIIHSRNQYMVQFSKLLGLGIHKPESSTVGIYDGKTFVFKESSWYICTIASLLWNYGLSIFHLFKNVGSLLNDFSRIYTLQDKGYAYTTVDQLLNAMNPDFTVMTQNTIEHILQEKGYSGRFLNEFVQSVTMVNYGQTNNMSGFAGFVALAGADNNLWSVEGGNKLIPEGLLEKSKAKFIKANVLDVTLLPDENFSLQYQESSSSEPIKSTDFDIVVLSAPLITGNTNIKFVNFSESFQQFEREYHQTVSTFVKSTINPSAFNEKNIPDDILTYNNSLIFNSIGANSPVTNVKYTDPKKVYKVFSKEPLSEESIKKLFKDVDIIKEKVWLAYPHYMPPEKFVPFVLHPGLYYTNAIELSASAMEMSAISAKNIALLIYNSWQNTVNNNDKHKTFLKDEF